ncbi:RNA-dependent DNA polymerase [Phytophthora megakarya]|uniref:RNA-dependent DNA polymerase n=1 Tax=Phytophthora megakarya TaxID=4795 RepID=A0A225VNA0_9STRA|nr:RNA-dependent DNA polymerase [Phytophthora megakarya]
MSWCGRIIDGEGVRQDPERLSGLVSLPLPQTAADLQRFLCACNWIRDSIVDFARVFEPLQSKLNGALENRSRTKRSASAVNLNWTEEERVSYSRTLQSIANSAKLFYPEDEATICLMTDASDYGYSIFGKTILS